MNATKTTRHFCRLMGVLVCSAASAWAQGEEADKIIVSGTPTVWASLDEVLERNRAEIGRRVGEVLVDPSSARQTVALSWLVTQEASGTMTLAELMSVWESVSAVHSVEVRALTEHLAKRILDRSNRPERVRWYRDAVRAGRVQIWRDAYLTRRDALSRAADEGLSEFEPDLERYGDELQPSYNPPYRAARERLWTMRLRAGGADHEECTRLEGKRLAQTSGTELLRLVLQEPDFIEAMNVVAEQECVDEKALESPCRDVARAASSLVLACGSGMAAEAGSDRVEKESEDMVRRLGGEGLLRATKRIRPALHLVADHPPPPPPTKLEQTTGVP